MAFSPISSVLGAANLAGNSVGNVANGIGTIQKLGSAISNLANPSTFMSSIRSMNIPLGANGPSSKGPTEASYSDGANAADWRVRLSIPPINAFKSSIFEPLVKSGGLIFPYTPTITISHQANYADQTITHQNYQFVTYQFSKVSDIQIIGDFAVEDAAQAQYWLSAVHFLRSVTKMFTGEDAETAGNPPPILLFNAYGDYVFKNIPVVVKGFQVTLPKEVDYITTNMRYLPQPRGPASPEGGLDGIGRTANLLSGVLSAVGRTKSANLLGGIGSLANGLSTAQGFGTSIAAGNKSSAGDSHVPTQSSFSVTLMPIYSRTRVREFSLSKFVQGQYVDKGYL